MSSSTLCPPRGGATGRQAADRALADRLIRAGWCIAGSEWAARCHCLYAGWIDAGRITPAGRRALRQLESDGAA